MLDLPKKWTLIEIRTGFEIPEIGLKWMRSHSTDKLDDIRIKNSEIGQKELVIARLIVKACNHHNELLETLKTVSGYLQASVRFTGKGQELLIEVDNIIAKGETI